MKERYYSYFVITLFLLTIFLDASTEFNAVDKVEGSCNAVDNWEDNITTKEANSSYTLTILSKEGNKANSKTISRIDLYYFSSGNQTECNDTYYKSITICQNSCGSTDSSGCKNIDIDISSNDRAVKCVEVHIEGDSNESNSSDDYAIRPKEFTITLKSSTAKAGENFDTKLQAIDSNGNEVKDYNESLHSSFEINATELKSGCKTGNLSVEDFNFSDGSASGFDINYSEVGEINLSISESNGSEFALVDSDDTNDSQRIIKEADTNLTLTPHHFKIDSNLYNFDKDNNFTYLSKDLNMSAKVDINITAQNKDNKTTENFIKECYAKDVNLSISHSNISSDALNYLGYILEDANDSNGSANWDTKKNDEIDLNITDSNFSTKNSRVDKNGTTVLSLYFNFDRNVSNPLNPFELNITRTSVTEGSVDASDNIQNINGDSHFFYGRLFANDTLSSKPQSQTQANLLFFDDNDSSKEVDNSDSLLINWWTINNQKESDGNIKDYNVTISFNLSGPFDTEVSLDIKNLANNPAYYPITIKNDETIDKIRIVHLAISSWLWFSFDEIEYNYKEKDPNSDCTKHPCFIYRYHALPSDGIVKSGEYNGSDFNISEDNRTIHGVKVFR